MTDFGGDYTSYLLKEPRKISCVKLGEVLSVDNKQINRFLMENRATKELYDEVEPYIDLKGGQLCIDDSVLDKEFSIESKSDLAGKFWSGRHKRVVLGINLITLFYVDKNGRKFPVNWRVYDKEDGKTKNDYFLEMFSEVLFWGLEPSMVSGDSRYASAKNLKFITKQGMGFDFSLKSNRLVRTKNAEEYQNVSELQIPQEGIVAHLKDVGTVKLFEHQGFIHAYRPPNQEKKRAWKQSNSVTRKNFELSHRNHWSVEEYHRVVKQVCNIEKHTFRNKNCILAHIFFSLRAFCVLEVNVALGNLKNRYSYMSDSLKQYMTQTFSSVSLSGLVFQN